MPKRQRISLGRRFALGMNVEDVEELSAERMQLQLLLLQLIVRVFVRMGMFAVKYMIRAFLVTQ